MGWALAQNASFMPLTMFTERGPVLAEDDEVDGFLTNTIDNNNVFHFEPTGMYYQGRELFFSLFEGAQCDVGPQQFAPGMQYIIRRDILHSRPCDHWSALQLWLSECQNFIWALERITTSLFNSTRPLKHPSKWQTPSFCTFNEKSNIEGFCN